MVCEYQEGTHIPVFSKEAYKVITTLENANIQLGYKFSILKASYAGQPSQAANEEIHLNIQDCMYNGKTT
jgi:hypothetical protein